MDIYTNVESGFSIEYPPDAKTTTRDPDPFPIVVQIDNLKPRTGGGGGPEFEDWMMYISETQPNPKNISLRQWAKVHNLMLSVDGKEMGSSETSPIDTTIGTFPAIEWTTSGSDALLTSYLIQRSNGVILIISYDNFGEDAKTISQILSTFKFTDKTTTTYTCPSNGWVDCMPGPDAKPECSKEAISWYKLNCPNFQGGAL